MWTVNQTTRQANMKTMTASVASKAFGQYLDSALREPVVITKQNRPVAVTVSFQDWEELIQLKIERGIAQGLEDIKHGRFETLNDASTAKRISKFKERISSSI